MLMVFIWLGSLLPEKYQATIRDCEDHPGNICFLLQDFHFQHYARKYNNLMELPQEQLKNLTLAEKTDLLRLLFLYENGGVYSDIDYTIDYPCLEKQIDNIKEALFFRPNQREPSVPSNNFLSCSTEKHLDIENVLKKLKECENCRGEKFASLEMFNNPKDNIFDLGECHKKTYQNQNSWKKNLDTIFDASQNLSQTRAFNQCLSSRDQASQFSKKVESELESCKNEKMKSSKEIGLIEAESKTLIDKSSALSEELEKCQIESNQTNQHIQKTTESFQEVLNCQLKLKQKSLQNEKSNLLLISKKSIIDTYESYLHKLELSKKIVENPDNKTQNFEALTQIQENVVETAYSLIQKCQNKVKMTIKDWIILSGDIIILAVVIALIAKLHKQVTIGQQTRQ